MEQLDRFRASMENNSKFQYNTINTYCLAVSQLISRYGENPTIEQLNEFIAAKCKKRSANSKYAIKEYLKFIGRQAEYSQLNQAKEKKPIRIKTFLTMAQLNMILAKIEHEPYKTIAKLQAATAARSFEILNLERRRVIKEADRIRLNLHMKGDKPRIAYLHLEYWPLIEPFYKEQKSFLFLEREAGFYTNKELTTRISTVYKRYLEQLQAAAKACGLNMATHDIRRSIANLINRSANDPRAVQKILGHESLTTTEKYLEDNSEQAAALLLKQQSGIQL